MIRALIAFCLLLIAAPALIAYGIGILGVGVFIRHMRDDQ